MRISSGILAVAVCLAWVAPTGALDPDAAARERATLEAFRSGQKSYLAGDKGEALKALSYAANAGHTAAAWKLGRMYADGDGVRRDEQKAFEYFRRIAEQDADEPPGSPQAYFVATAFVELGGFYLRGIPGTQVRRDPDRARRMYEHAASYFGFDEAQYRLARLYLDGTGGLDRDPLRAARWLQLAAKKGHYQAQALLGDLLIRGEGVPRQAAQGLAWLIKAREAAAVEADGWIVKLYETAMQTASLDDKAMADTYLRQWLKTSGR